VSCKNPIQRHHINTRSKIHDNGQIKFLPHDTVTATGIHPRMTFRPAYHKIIKEYNLNDKVTAKGFICIKVTKGIYGLPQAGLLVNGLLETQLNKHGYVQRKLVPGLWKHQTRPIQFTLVINTLVQNTSDANMQNISIKYWMNITK
ncbi:hypothetical protein ACHAW6_000747, partial [Cyclotella cf. meneghiniana]